MLFHFISAESDDPKKDYQLIRKELGAHNKALLKKTEYLFLSKSDILDETDRKKKLAILKKLNANASATSVNDEESMKKMKELLNKIKSAK